MKKLKLELDAILVESFSTAPKTRGNGTVRGLDGQWSIDGGAYCSWECGNESHNPYCGTAAVTCEYGPTMNPMDVECMDATMAGTTCNGAETCYNTCPY